ncbi:FHA domain-containing protein [Kitasatospora sp. NPDC086009]|uniref:FHA domain-containing protein n=1 Tax=unclassified Kitasatospora TaxID=2633591 RepID=UPI0037C66E01
MPICPRGHESQAEDWCDFCGFPMTPPPPIPPPPGTHPGAPGAPAAHGGHGGHDGFGGPGAHGGQGYPGHGGAPFGGPVQPRPEQPGPGAVPPGAQGFPDLTEGLVVCPICRSPQTGRFCEECGYDYDLSSPSRRQPPPSGGAPAGGPGPDPLNIPAAYGGPQPPAQQPQPPHAQQQRPAYGYPQLGGEPYQEARHQEPAYQEQPYQEAAYQERPHQESGYQEQQPYQERPREDSGPVYAQPGPNGRGAEFGTSFNLAPPVLPQPPQAPQAPQQVQQQPPQQHPHGQQVPQPPQPAPQPEQAQQQAHQPPYQGAQPEPVRTNWIAVVSADRDYFTDMMARSGPEAAGLFFPPYCPERRIPLTGRGQLRIGRRSQHRGTVPEIDLSVPPEDPGASHQHALLAEQSDGSWVLVDQDSTNGTTMNGGAESLTPHTAVPLNDGDRIHIGAWTTITLHRA